MDFSSFLTIIYTIIILILVIVIANISLRFVNKNMIKHNRLIKIIEKVGLSNNSSIGVVQICGNYYLMSFTGADNKILKELDKDDVEDIIKNIEENRDFDIGGSFLKNLLGMRDKS